MALLSLADHSILSYGTFGMWGALLSGDGTSQQRAAGTHPRMQKQIVRGARHSQNDMGHGDEILNFKVL